MPEVMLPLEMLWILLRLNATSELNTDLEELQTTSPKWSGEILRKLPSVSDHHGLLHGTVHKEILQLQVLQEVVLLTKRMLLEHALLNV
jgi:hypothetical protein